MKSTDLRAKARAIFGSAIAEPMPKQPNGAKALQQRANARPIPTYKVGGAVKKPTVPTPRGSPEADDVLITTRRGQQILEEQRRRDAQRDRAADAKRKAADKLLGIPAQKGGGKAGCYKDGGKVQTSSDTARKLAKEMGGMKKGGKAKDGLAVMIAIGSPKKPVKKADGGSTPSLTSSGNYTGAPAQVSRSKATATSASQKTSGYMPKPAPEKVLRERVVSPNKRAAIEAAADRGARGVKLPTPPMEPKFSYKDGGRPVKKADGGKASDRGPTTQAQADAAYFRMQGARALVAPKGGTQAALSRMPNDKPAAIVQKNDTPVPRGTAKAMYDEMKRNPPKPVAPTKETRAPEVIVTGRPETPPLPPPPPPLPVKKVYKEGGRPVKKAVGGAGKVRKGMAPIKKAQGGAAKVRKGMMSPEGKILNAIGKVRGK